MGWRRVTELAVFVESLELIEQVEAETARVTFAGEQCLAAADDERKTGHAFDALVRRGNEIINSRRR